MESSFQSLSGSGAPVVAFASSDYIDPSLVFTSDISELISPEDQQLTSRLEDGVENDAIAAVEPVIPPKRSHRKKDGSRVRDRKRSRTKITPKRAVVGGGGGGGGGGKDTSSSSSSSSPPVKGNEATRAGVKMSAAKTAAAAAAAAAVAAAVEDDEEEDSPREILTALSPMEFCPLGQFPGSGSPMLVTSREGATPRGSSAAFVLLTTKSSHMTTLASPKPTLPSTPAAMSSSLLSLSSADKSITSSPSRVLTPSPLRSSPSGGSPMKVQQSDLYHSSASSTVEVNHALEGSSSSSSSPLVLPPPPLPRSSRRMRAQVQFVQRGDEPDEEILVLLSSSSS